MADYATKTIPPKFTQIEKQIKVRIFSVEGRTVLFTKKDSLMKHDVPLYPSIKAVKQGERVVGVIVAQNDHGYIIKSFGELKGLLSFNETKDLKIGGVVNSYVLFNKKGSGLALTLKKESKSKQQNYVD
jgi:hypothetical protein